MTTYTWTDDTMRSGSTCNVDKVADNLMHLKYDASGGVCKLNNLGTISANITLTENYITTGDVSGNYTLTLPTVTDTEKQVTCVFDFTTTSANYPTITNSNLKWSDKNSGQAPSAYSTTSGVRNILTFKSVWISGTLYWEAEYTTYGSVEKSFVQSSLSANGTLGGASFAAYASVEFNSYYAYYAFDENDSTTWVGNTSTGDYLIFYNPSALKVSKLKFYCGNSNCVNSLALYGSNDNSTYTFIQNCTGIAYGTTTSVSVSSSSYYKYHKLVVTALSTRAMLNTVSITATYIET